MARLTSTALREMDDFLSDTLIDLVYWSPTRKFDLNYQSSPSPREIDRVISILRYFVVQKKDIPTAITQLLQLDRFKQFTTSCSGTQTAFQRILRRYLYIYLPDCPFEISKTTRFASKAPDAATRGSDAAIMAIESIEKGEEIKYLQGIKAWVDPEEQDALKSSGQDFSLLKLDMGTYVLAGPACRLNHSREFNARLSRTGHFIRVIAEQDIGIGEEITIYYGEEYFYPGVEVLGHNEEDEMAAAARLERHWNLYGQKWPMRSIIHTLQKNNRF